MPRLPFPATVRVSGRRATSGKVNLGDLTHAATSAARPSSNQAPRQQRPRRDPLRDHRAVMGAEARTPWYIRIRALMILIVIVVCVSMAIAGLTLLLIASGRFVLETLAG